MKTTYIVAALALLTSACSADYEIEQTRTAIAAFVPGPTVQTGHLIFAVGNGPMACPATSQGTIAVGPGCDSPSWHVKVTIPESLVGEGNTINIGSTPGIFTEMGQQGDGCHTGEPKIDTGQLEIVDILPSEVVVDLQVTTQSSVDPSGTYTAPLCQQ